MQAKHIAEKLAQQVENVLKHLLPEGKGQGNYWCVGSVKGEPGQSLKVCFTGSKAGVWSDFATGQAGDLLDLWAAGQDLSLREALYKAKQWPGLTSPTFVS